MLAEIALYLLTPAERTIQRLGMVRDSVQLWSRGRRFRKYWLEHEKHCHAIVRQSMQTVTMHRKAYVLGSGLCRDIPIEELCRAFREVILVDAVHLPNIRYYLRNFKNITFMTREITGYGDTLIGGGGETAAPRLDDIIFDPDADLIISANILSQLAIPMEEWIETHPSKGAKPHVVVQSLVNAHLDALRGALCTVCLLTDVAMLETNRHGEIESEHDLLGGAILPPADAEWLWAVAPHGVPAPDLAYIHRVRGYVNFEKTQRG